ncbi:hypothetical protein MCERH10_02586 [Caulobacteraceae bacterium]|jgi:hypothetical protein
MTLFLWPIFFIHHLWSLHEFSATQRYDHIFSEQSRAW